ncbi:nitroreductase [Nakamurella sp. A5-74]|uniref:Nitroreductase n=1 Tax=Nakamurella sp. A5-74 TaxID=3158264 RepID=A0AAU8DTR3_9ACTN
MLDLHPEQVRGALSSACRAPSLLNSQPWAFMLGADHIELHLDTRRLLRSADPERRQALIACGAALFNLRLALVDLGVRVDERIWPDGPDGPLARVSGGAPARPRHRLLELARAIPHRRSNPRPFLAVPVPIAFQQVLLQAAAGEGATLHLVTEPHSLVSLRTWTVDARRRDRADPERVSERVRWAEAGRSPKPTAADLRADGHRWTPTTDEVPRSVDGDDPPDGANEQPLIAVLTTVTDTPGGQVAAGLALERTLLSATALGLSMSTLPELVEFAPARDRIRCMLGTGDFPQALVRLGFDGPVRPSGRRPVEDCLITGPLTAADR